MSHLCRIKNVNTQMEYRLAVRARDEKFLGSARFFIRGSTGGVTVSAKVVTRHAHWGKNTYHMRSFVIIISHRAPANRPSPPWIGGRIAHSVTYSSTWLWTCIQYNWVFGLIRTIFLSSAVDPLALARDGSKCILRKYLPELAQSNNNVRYNQIV